MAIIDVFEAKISVDGLHLKEHIHPNDQAAEDADYAMNKASHVTRYVEVQEGEEFAVLLRLHSGYHLPRRSNGIVWQVLIDGNHACSTTFAGFTDFVSNDQYGSFEGFEHTAGGQDVRQNFKFKPLQLSQDLLSTDINTLEKQYIARGTITVKAYHYWFSGTLECKSSHQKVEDLVVPEKAVKGRAVTLGVGHGMLHVSNAKARCQGKYIGRSIASFNFEYRTKSSLQDLMVVRRTPSPELEMPLRPELELSLRERDLDTLDLAESKQLIKELKDDLDQAKGITPIEEGDEFVTIGRKRDRGSRPKDDQGAEFILKKRSKQN